VDINKIILVGRLGSDPEMRFTSGGRPVCEFSLACGRTWKTPEGEEKKQTEWFKVVTWDKWAETVNQFAYKGQLVYVEGRVETRKWEGKDGNKNTTVSVQATTISYLSHKQKAAETPEPAEEVGSEDLPY
jgi:single-strand DNA-binding protein